MKSDMRKAFITSIPVMMGYIVLGMAFGMLLQSKGYNLIYAFLMSTFIYAGSMQFVAIDLLSGGATLINAAIMTLLINARHMVYGLSMLKRFEKTGKYKPYMIFSLTDETYSLLVKDNNFQGIDDKRYIFFISLFNQCYWILGSVIGTIVGDLLTINTEGLDFAMTALFIVIVIEQMLYNNKHIYNYIGFVISIISLVIFGSEGFIIPAMIGIIISLLVLYKRGKNYA